MRIFGIYWVTETTIKINLCVFYFKCGYQKILSYIYMGCLCGSIFMESSDLGLWKGYVWFLHNISLNLREFGGFIVCLIGFLFVS